jgi:hypothetical protein
VKIDTFHDKCLSTDAMNPRTAVLLAPAPKDNSITSCSKSQTHFLMNGLIFGGVHHLDQGANSSIITFSKKPFE